MNLSAAQSSPRPDDLKNTRQQSIRGRIILLVLALALLVAVATLLNPPGINTKGDSADSLPPHSIYSTTSSGCRAWYLTLQQAGLPIQVWDRPLSNSKRPATPSTLVLISPQSTFGAQTVFSELDAKTLFDWASQGHTVVLLDDFSHSATQNLLKQLHPHLKTTFQILPALPKNSSTAKPNRLNISQSLFISLLNHSPQPLTFQVRHPILTHSRRFFSDVLPTLDGLQTELEDRQKHPYLVSLPYGRGRLILGTTADLVENRYLNTPSNDNFQFLANLLTAEKKPILIDEFIHGYMASPDLTEYFRRKTPLGHFLTALGMGFLFTIWLGLKRWPSASRQESPAFSAHDEEKEQSTPTGAVGAFANHLALMYARTQAAPLALGPLLDEFDRQLEKRFGISGDDEFAIRHLLTQRLASYSNNREAPFEPHTIEAINRAPNNSCESWLLALQKAREVVEGQKRLPPANVLQLSRQLIIIQEILHGSPIHNPAR